MSLRIVELFGFAPTDLSPEAKRARTNGICPFSGKGCNKSFKSGDLSGVCSVQPATTDPVICCPIRMYAGEYKILQDVAVECFGPEARLIRNLEGRLGDGRDVVVFGKGWGKELRLPNRTMSGGYFVDWILALLDSTGNLKEFVAVEVQTMDTSGSYEDQAKAFLTGDTSAKPSKKAGINWENVSKRILPQLIYKGHVLRREPLCTKGMFFICPKPVYERIISRLGGSLQTYHPQAGALTFRWYDIGTATAEGRARSLEYVGQKTTTIDQVALAFTSPQNLPEPGVYQKAISAGLSD